MILTKYVIGSGFFCTEDGNVKHGGTARFGTDTFVHTPEFFNLWFEYISKFTTPEYVFITDARSPAVPGIPKNNNFDIIWYRRKDNLGHARGWNDGVIQGAEFAHQKNCDYVYVEQDCLVYGKGWVEKCMYGMDKPVLLGEGGPGNWPIQQCLIVVKNYFIPTFVKLIGETLKDEAGKDIAQEYMYSRRLEGHYEFIPFVGGRHRPLADDYWYAQHIKPEELKKMKELI